MILVTTGRSFVEGSALNPICVSPVLIRGQLMVDQLFIQIKQWLISLLGGAPDWLVQMASALINIFAVLGVFLTLFALISVLERKILGRMQNRYGPNRVGPFGLFQPVADGIKMLIKEDI